MKNRDLILELLRYNFDADVNLGSGENINISYISEDVDGNKSDERNTKQIFIEKANPICVHAYYNKYGICLCGKHNDECTDMSECFYFEE